MPQPSRSDESSGERRVVARSRRPWVTLVLSALGAVVFGGICIGVRVEGPEPLAALIFFLGVPALVCLGILIWAIVQFTRGSLYYYELSVSPVPARLGEYVTAHLYIHARKPLHMGRVAVTLRCKETAVRGSGKNSTTYTEIAFEVPWVAADELLLRPGEGIEVLAQVQVPPEGMCTFKAASNSVRWYLHVHAPVPGWRPDLSQICEVKVLPVRVREAQEAMRPGGH